MHVTRQQLSTDNPEYQEVSAVFRKGAKTKDFVLSIEAIEKVTNPALQQAFDINKAKYRRQYGHVRTVKVFHGTKITNIPSILKNNLEVRRHGQNRGHRFGAGVSFSAISNYSSHYCDENVPVKQMLLCLVLVSNIIEVPEMKKKRYTICEPPFLEGHWPLRYDTTAKNKTTMDVIVKFEDHTFYPAFVVSFRKRSKMCPSVASPSPVYSSEPIFLPRSVQNDYNRPPAHSSLYRDPYSVHPARTHVPVRPQYQPAQYHSEPFYTRAQPQPATNQAQNTTGFWDVISAIGRFIFG